MSQHIQDFLTRPCDLLGLGEPTHWEPAFPKIRNELLPQLVDLGFRSIAMETCRVQALIVDDYVRNGTCTLEEVMRTGFSHGLGEYEANRGLVAWLREHNRTRPPAEQVGFHGIDAPTEQFSAPSPRRYLEYARDYLGVELDLAGLLGPDERWSRREAVWDHTESPGTSPAADQAREVAEDLLRALRGRASELIAATSPEAWRLAKLHLDAGLGLLRYHRQAAEPVETYVRVSRLMAVRGGLMTRNLWEIRELEAGRGSTLVCAHNSHLQRNRVPLNREGKDHDWVGTGMLVDALLGERYVFIAGSLGHSEALELGEPEPETFEGQLQGRISGWGLTAEIPVSGVVRTDVKPQMGFVPLDSSTVDRADAVLHVS